MSHRDTDNPLEALSDALAFNSRDFAESQFEAWIWGIVQGWDNEDDEPDCGDAMASVAAKVGWNEHHVARLRRLRSNFRRIEAAAPDLLAAREITTAEDLAAVAPGTIIRAADGTIACRHHTGVGVVFGDERPFDWSALKPPATVLWSPSDLQGGSDVD